MDNVLAQTLIETSINTKNIRKKIRETLEERKSDTRYPTMLLHMGDYLYNTAATDEDIGNIISMFTCEEICEKILLAVSYTTQQKKPVQAIATILGQELCIKCPFTAVDVAAALLLTGCESNLYDVFLIKNRITVKANFTLSQSLLDSIEYAQYPMPMLCKPKEVTGHNNIDDSHLISRSSLILGKQQHNSLPISLDTVNILNAIPLALDMETLYVEETSNKPLDTKDKVEQFERMKRDSVKIYEYILDFGNEFFLTWKYDHRGRVYSQGYHVNLQSTDYKKSIISLAKEELLSE